MSVARHEVWFNCGDFGVRLQPAFAKTVKVLRLARIRKIAGRSRPRAESGCNRSIRTS